MRPLQKWICTQGVRFVTDCLVTDLEFDDQHNGVVVSAIRMLHNGVEEQVTLKADDLCFLQETGVRRRFLRTGRKFPPDPSSTKENSPAGRKGIEDAYEVMEEIQKKAKPSDESQVKIFI